MDNGNGGEEMSVGHYHGLCQRYRGRAVEIRTHRGTVHRGVIERVSRNQVYLRPINRPGRLGGFGFGYYGGWGFGWGLALGAIASLVLIPFFFW